MAKVNPINLQKALKGTKYPASKKDLMKAAETNGCDDSISGALKKLPEQQFTRPSDVSKAIKELE